MISAAAKGLARLAYEFSDLVLTALKLLPGTLALLRSNNREIIKVCFIVHFSKLNALLPILFSRTTNEMCLVTSLCRPILVF